MGIETTLPEESPLLPEKHRFATLDDAIDYYTGEVTWRQLLQITIISLGYFFDAQQTFIGIFTDAQPKWICLNSDCISSATTCTLPPDSYSWVSPPQSSTVSTWSLQCGDPIIAALPSTSFFAGAIAGGLLLSPLSDTLLGRKRMLVFCCLLMSVAGAITAASINIWMYSFLRFISGVGRNMIGGCVLVHSAELVGKKWRPKVGVFGFVSFALGFLSLPLIAFLLRENSWRFVYLSTCIPCVFYCLIVQLFVDESPRWLFIRSRKTEFAETLLRISSPERRRASATELSESINWDFVDQQSQETMSFYSSIKLLFQEKWVRRRLVIISAAFFCVGLAYYGLPFSLDALSLNLYLGVVINALMEFPASLIAFITVGNVDRRISIFGLSTVSGVCGVLVAVVMNKGLQMGLEIAAFTTAVTVFDLIMIYALELFPTCVRNSALTVARLAVNLGGAIFKLAAAAGGGDKFVSFGVTGVAIFSVGVLVSLLPETRGKQWSDLMAEEAHQRYQAVPATEGGSDIG